MKGYIHSTDTVTDRADTEARQGQTWQRQKAVQHKAIGKDIAKRVTRSQAEHSQWQTEVVEGHIED